MRGEVSRGSPSPRQGTMALGGKDGGQVEEMASGERANSSIYITHSQWGPAASLPLTARSIPSG